jgi:hypothetical protein
MALTSIAHLLGMLQVVAVALSEAPVDRHLDPDNLVHDAADMASFGGKKDPNLFFDAQRV